MKYLSTKRNLNTNKDYYEVEKIITRKTFGKNRMYLIKWLGYPLKDCSWEPISNLSSISDMVENFDQNFPNSVDKRQLKKYLYIIKHRESHIIRIKNPFLDMMFRNGFLLVWKCCSVRIARARDKKQDCRCATILFHDSVFINSSLYK